MAGAPSASSAHETAPLLRAAAGDNHTSFDVDDDNSDDASSFLSDSTAPSHRRRRRHASLVTQRNISFVTSVAAALAAGSFTVFSLYGHLLQSRLHYSQYQVNGIASLGSLALYLPIPLFGFFCDRVGPRPLAALAVVMGGGGYGLAAGLYYNQQQSGGDSTGPSSLGYVLMIVAFVLIGSGSCALYIGAVTTCAKNFGKGKHRGLALAMPITAIGLSGVWLSQVGSHVLYERLPDGSKGDVNVVYFFLFLAVLYAVLGTVGAFTMKVIDEQDLIDEAVEELERSGLLDGSALFHQSSHRTAASGSYGTLERIDPEPIMEDQGHQDQDPAKDFGDDNDDDDQDNNAKFKKNWVLNAETRRFLSDHTMWLFAAGFFLAVGPGEAFINNMGTVIKTLYPPPTASEAAAASQSSVTSAATHVSIICATSTAVRLLVGAITDLVAPSPTTQHLQVPPLHSNAAPPPPPQRRLCFNVSISRVAFLLLFALLLSLGLAFLASGACQNHAERFWIVSSLIGAGYGALFSIAPIIVTMIWGVENFGTNWGIVAIFPAAGNALWGSVYSAVYQAGAAAAGEKTGAMEQGERDLFCYGMQCYSAAYWAMAGSVWVACLLVLWAWKGRNGWSQRGIVI